MVDLLIGALFSPPAPSTKSTVSGGYGGGRDGVVSDNRRGGCLKRAFL
jgi:hypothetical protein